MSANKVVVDDRLCAGLNASHPVAHGVQASLGRVDLDDLLQLGFASLQLLLPVDTMLLAFLHH